MNFPSFSLTSHLIAARLKAAPQRMNHCSKYRITIENESKLENIARVSVTPLRLAVFAALAVIIIMIAGAFIIFLSPARTLLPGYLKDSERAATEEQHMRLDSLQQAYDTNALFLANIMNVLSEEPIKQNPREVSEVTVPLSADSLLPRSAEEEKFVAMMNEREKYNIAVIAPLAAESMMFAPVNEESVFSSSSRRSIKGEIILGRHVPVAAVADGTVIAVSQSLKEGGAVVLIQHNKGFLSRLSRLGNVIIEPGDEVTAGQIIAISSEGSGRRQELINIEMWHNGTPLIPYDYIGDESIHQEASPVVDLDVGRGRL